MISRKSAMAITEAYCAKFTYTPRYSRSESPKVYRDNFYDFLYEHEYEAWFANMVKSIFGVREFKDWLLRIHTGESLEEATPNWTWEQRKTLGQTYLLNLARDFVVWFEEHRHEPWNQSAFQEQRDEVVRRLELDGYLFRDGEFLSPESDVLDVEAEKGVLQSLYRKLKLEREAEALEFLRLAEVHFVSGHWSDAISNSRKYFELTMLLVARRYSEMTGHPLAENATEKPVLVRDFLERETLVEKKEREAIDKIYGLLSHTGAHPYMAEKDQARLLRQLALTTSQFVLLRLEGALA